MLTHSNPDSAGYARTTGIYYLIIAAAGAFSIGYVPQALSVPGDPLARPLAMVANRGLFSAGIGADAIVMLAEIMATAMLLMMFRKTNATLSLVAALARLSMVGVMAAMLLFHAAALGLAEAAPATAQLAQGERLALAHVMLGAHDAGVWVWQLFFWLHLLVLGILVARSGLYPRWLGAALALGGFGYLLDSLHGFAFPQADLLNLLRIALLVLVTLAELGFALWLILRGPRPAVQTPPQSLQV